MNWIKKVWNKINKPKGIWLSLFYITFIIVISFTLYLVITDANQSILHYILYCVSAVLLTYFVYTIVIFTPKIKNKILELLKKHKFTNELLENFGYRTIIFSIFSMCLNVAYVVFQGILAFMTLSAWYISLTAYYLVLSILKGNVFYSKKWSHNDPIRQAKTYRWCGFMFIFLTLALSGIIVLIYTSNMYFEYAGLMIYAVAAYTFYMLTLSIINIFKARKQSDLYIQSIRNINLVTSVVSIVVLQVALFQAFSPESNTSFANGSTGGAVSIIILSLGSYMVIKANKIIKSVGETNEQHK